MRWFDSHCHLHIDGATPDDAGPLVEAARTAGVDAMVTIGCDVADSQAAIAVARANDGVWATAGVHPHDAAGGLDGLEALLGDPQVVAIGECGLDYHYDHSPRAAQREVFAAQIQLAHRHDMALVIHTREAWDDTFDILAAEGVPERTVFHCFSGGAAEARKCLDLGTYLSFSGIISFKSATDLREAAAICPLDRLLVETDSPFLAPVPHRGKPNQPALVPVVGAAVAAARGVEPDELAESSWAAATALYRLA